MLSELSQNARARFSCVPKPSRTFSKDGEERLRLVRERVGTVLDDCGFASGDAYLPNPAKHTDSVDTVDLSKPESAWRFATERGGIRFFDRPASGHDTGHRDGLVLYSSSPLDRDVGIFFAPADCAIVGFAHRDPAIDCIAMAHAGWRGTAKDIIGNTVNALREILGTAAAKDLEAFVSPYALSCCYEFGKDTFVRAFVGGEVPETDGKVTTLRSPFWKKYGTPSMFGLEERGGGTYLNTGLLLSKSLRASGISEDRTKDLSVCTVCEGHEKGYSSSRIDPHARFGVFLSLDKRRAA